MPTSSPDPHPLGGAGLHFRDDHGAVTIHAAVLAVFPSNRDTVGDLALLQLYDLFDRTPTTRRIVPLVDLSDHHWIVFASAEAMHDHHRPGELPPR